MKNSIFFSDPLNFEQRALFPFNHLKHHDFSGWNGWKAFLPFSWVFFSIYSPHFFNTDAIILKNCTKWSRKWLTKFPDECFAIDNEILQLLASTFICIKIQPFTAVADKWGEHSYCPLFLQGAISRFCFHTSARSALINSLYSLWVDNFVILSPVASFEHNDRFNNSFHLFIIRARQRQVEKIMTMLWKRKKKKNEKRKFTFEKLTQ